MDDCSGSRPDKSNSCEGFSFPSNSHEEKMDGTSDSPTLSIGDDGSYYVCVVCKDAGELLCCDTCPSTYHLECLSPPLGCVPSEDWRCKKCHQKAIKGSSQHSSSSKRKIALPDSIFSNGAKKQGDSSSHAPVCPKSSSNVEENLPARSFPSLLYLAEAGETLEKASKRCIRDKGKESAVSQIGDEGRTDISTKMDEPIVYKRNMWKKNVTEDEDIRPRKSVSGSSASETVKNDHNDALNAVHHPRESNEKPTKKQGEASCGLKSKRLCTGSPNIHLLNRLSIANKTLGSSIIRNVVKQSTNGRCTLENNEGRELELLACPKYTEAGRAQKEKFAKLRSRQKGRIALRKSCVPAPSSGLVRAEQRVEPQLKLNESARVNAPKKYIAAIPLRTILSESEKDKWLCQYRDGVNSHETHKNSFSVPLVHHERPKYNQNKFGGQLPVSSSHQVSDAGCSSAAEMKNQKFGVHDISSHILNTSAIPQVKHGNSGQAMTSNFSSNPSTMRTWWHSTIKDEKSENGWRDMELDSLWLGVRRHGQDDWETVLSDPNLLFSEQKKKEDLAERWWKQERVKIVNFEDSTSRRSGTDNSKGKNVTGKWTGIDLNKEPSLDEWLPSNQEETSQPKLLLGGHFEIPPVRIESGNATNQLRLESSPPDKQEDVEISPLEKQEDKEISSEGTISG